MAGPSGLQFGPDGNLDVVDLLSGAVRSYDPTTGNYVGDLIAAGGALNNQFPSDLLFDDQGNLLIADLGSDFTTPTGGIKEFDTSGNFIGDFATSIDGASQLLLVPDSGSGPAAFAAVPEPTSLALCGSAAAVFAAIGIRRRRVARR